MCWTNLNFQTRKTILPSPLPPPLPPPSLPLPSSSSLLLWLASEQFVQNCECGYTVIVLCEQTTPVHLQLHRERELPHPVLSTLARPLLWSQHGLEAKGNCTSWQSIIYPNMENCNFVNCLHCVIMSVYCTAAHSCICTLIDNSWEQITIEDTVRPHYLELTISKSSWFPFVWLSLGANFFKLFFMSCGFDCSLPLLWNVS